MFYYIVKDILLQNNECIANSVKKQNKNEYFVFRLRINKNYSVLMNRSFEYVINSALNKSKSKQAHLFAQSKRFKDIQKSPCITSSYDLSKTMLASTCLASKSTVFPRGDRFISNRSVSPPPNAYHSRSFIDLNDSNRKGNSFGQEQKLRKIDKTKVPGPGSYQQTYNPQKKLSYTMRSKVNNIDHRSKLGPGQYNVDSYDTIAQQQAKYSKYQNTKNTKFPKNKRFNDKQHLTPSLGAPAYENKLPNPTAAQYTFTLNKKDSSYIRKSITPGPGFYNQFSEFSQLKKGQPNQRNIRMRTYL